MSEPTMELGRFRLFFWQSWSDIFNYEQMNWIDIEMIRMHFEHAPYKESIEMNISLVGFNLSADWHYGSLKGEPNL